MRDRSNDAAMAEMYREEPEFAVDMLNTILEDGGSTQADLLIVLRQLAMAYQGMPALAGKAALNPTQLYRTLSEKGNPEFRSMVAILKALGLQLMVKPIRQVTKSAPARSARPRRKSRPAAKAAKSPSASKAA